MKVERYVIIGNSTAAVAAVEAIRSVDPRGTITLVASEPYHTYSRPLISYYLSGQVGEEQLLYRPPAFYQKNGVTPRLATSVVGLDPVNRRLMLEPASPQSKKSGPGSRCRPDPGEYLEFDRLLLATGSRPAAPPLPGLNLSGVHYFYTLDQVKAIRAEISKNTSVVVLGAGLIGMKAAEALNKLGCPVAVVEVVDRILGTVLDPEAASLDQSWMEEHGIKFYLNRRATEIAGSKKVTSVKLDDGTELKCSLVVIATGVRPNLELAAGSAIKTQQGIEVNQFQETSVPGVFCAGDVCQGFDRLSGKSRLTPILPSAYHQGWIAGLNMAGRPTANPGLVAFNSTTFFGLPVVTMGLGFDAQPAGAVRLSRISGRAYRSLVFDGEQLVGGVFINCGQRAGILRRLVQDRVPVLKQKEYLLEQVPRLIDFPTVQLG